MTEHISLIDPLNTGKFSWQNLKKQSLVVAAAYQKLSNNPNYFTDKEEFYKHSLRTYNCGNYLQFKRYDVSNDLVLSQAYFCKDKFCPACYRRKYLKLFHQLNTTLNRIQCDHPTYDFLFGTLTQKNVSAGRLQQEIVNLKKCWDILLKRFRRLKASASDGSVDIFHGFFMTTEVTYHIDDSTGELTYHPHMHFIAVVDRKIYDKYSWIYDDNGKRKAFYYNQLKIDDLRKLWQDVLKTDYLPRCDINYFKGTGKMDSKKQLSLEASTSSNFVEASKADINNERVSMYLSKGFKFNGLLSNPEPLRDLFQATKGMQLYSCSGMFRRYFKDISDDLIHIDDDKADLRKDLAYVLETYMWHSSDCDYYLEV